MLRNITLFAGTMLVCSAAFAQTNSARVAGTATQISPKTSAVTEANRLVLCNDTLNREILDFSIWRLPRGFDNSSTPPGAYAGYISGTNSFGDKAKANIFPATGTSVITGAIMAFGQATIGANPNVQIPVKVWNSTTNTSGVTIPGTVAATKNIPLSQIVAAVNDTSYFVNVTFDSPVSVTGAYFIGVDLPATFTTGDSVAFITNDASGSSPYIGYEQWSDNSWHSYASAWGGPQANYSNVIIPFVQKTVTANFTFPTTLNLNAGQTVTYTNTSIGGTLNTWTFQGGNPSGSSATSPTVTYNTAGTYQVTLTHETATGCSETLTQTLTVTGTVGISEELANSVKVYPNPASGLVYISTAGVNAKNIVVTNAIGQVVSQQNVTAENSEVNISKLTTGMYYFQIVTNEGNTITKKVSVQN